MPKLNTQFLRLTIFPNEGKAQLEHVASIAVWMARTEAGHKLWWDAGDRRVDVDRGKHPVALAQQAVQHKQGQGWVCRVGVHDNVTEGTQTL